MGPASAHTALPHQLPTKDISQTMPNSPTLLSELGATSPRPRNQVPFAPLHLSRFPLNFPVSPPHIARARALQKMVSCHRRRQTQPSQLTRSARPSPSDSLSHSPALWTNSAPWRQTSDTASSRAVALQQGWPGTNMANQPKPDSTLQLAMQKLVQRLCRLISTEMFASLKHTLPSVTR